MQIGNTIVIMNMQNFKTAAKRRDKFLKIYSNNVCMARIKAEPQNLCSIFVIKGIDALCRLFRVAAWPLHKMPSYASIKIFNTDGYTHFLCKRGNRIYEFRRFLPFQFLHSKEMGKLEAMNNNMWTSKKRTYSHALRRHLIPQIIIDLFACLRHVNRIRHMHLVYCNSGGGSSLLMRHKKLLQLLYRFIKKVIQIRLIKRLV